MRRWVCLTPAPIAGHGHVLLFSKTVVIAGLLVPVAATRSFMHVLEAVRTAQETQDWSVQAVMRASERVAAARTVRDRGLGVEGRLPLPGRFIAGAVRDRGALALMLASADALVHGCEAETFGLVAAEAAASGLPLLVPDRGGACDQLAPGCGIAYRAADPKSLREVLTARQPADWRAWRAAARGRARQVRTMQTHFEQLFERYRLLIEPKRWGVAPGAGQNPTVSACGVI